jgi:hypothetical protein
LHGSSEVSLAAIPELLTQGVCCLHVSGAALDASSDGVTPAGYYQFECADFGHASLRRWLLAWQTTGFAPTAFKDSCDSLTCLPDESFILADIASAVNEVEDEVNRLNSSNICRLNDVTSANWTIMRALALISSLTPWDPFEIDANHSVNTRALLDQAELALQELKTCLLQLTPQPIPSTRITSIRRELDALSLQIRGMHEVYSLFASFAHRFQQFMALAIALAELAQIRDDFRGELANSMAEMAPRSLDAMKKFAQQLADMNPRIHRLFVPVSQKIESLLEARSTLGVAAAAGEQGALATLPDEVLQNNVAIYEELARFRRALRRAA